MYLKKVVFILISFFMFINVSAMDVDTYSKNAVLYNLNDDSIVAEEAKDEIVSIASMTKIMTTLVALENIDDINEKVTLTLRSFNYCRMSSNLCRKIWSLYGLLQVWSRRQKHNGS